MQLNPLAEAADLQAPAGTPQPRATAPIVFALIAQAGAAMVTIALWFLAGDSPARLLLAHAMLAGAIGARLGMPRWWIPINALFVPAAFWVHTLQLSPAWFLAGFVTFALFFWTTFRSRVPLYLSSREACEQLAQLLPSGRSLQVLDLGCGFGGLLTTLARARPAGRFTGVEIAPLPALVAWVRARRASNCHVIRGDFWRQDLAAYDAVYAFLSPAPMTELWRKARAEMRPGSLFISNSFPVDGVEPHAIVPLAGRGSSALYLWRL